MIISSQFWLEILVWYYAGVCDLCEIIINFNVTGNNDIYCTPSLMFQYLEKSKKILPKKICTHLALSAKAYGGHDGNSSW